MNGFSLNHSKGVGLIEVLITVLLLSTALLTLASLQTRALQYNQGSYFRSQANILAYDILDKIRVNKTNLGSYNLTLASFSSATAVTTPRAAVDIYEWRQDVNTRLPSAQAAIACSTTNRVCTITINWRDLNVSGHNFGSIVDDTEAFSYMTRIPESQ